MENTFFLSKKVDFWGKSLPLANLTALTSVTTRPNMQAFIAFAARKFGSY
jgi:hypothetical protein